MVPETLRASDMMLPAEKRRILARLQAYRDRHGLGCFRALSGGTVTEDLLRAVLSDAKLIRHRDWQAISRALDRAEREETANE